MIFLGDFVFPFSSNKFFFKFNKTFLREEKMLNLESSILDPDKYDKRTSGIALYSSLDTLEILNILNVKVVGIANNHILDFRVDIGNLKNILLENNIKSSGAGSNLYAAIKPVLCEDKKYKYAIYSFGWNVIGCKNADYNTQGVAPLDEELIAETVKNAKKIFPDRKIVLNFHWNYEFEYYPQPADRRLAFLAIDNGADIIVGHHPHIVGVYEIYKNKPIFYSLGNFFMPKYNFLGFDLEYNTLADVGLAIKYDDNVDKIVLFWIKNSQNVITITKEEFLYESKNIENFSSHFQNDLILYKNWFVKHRKKNKLLPVYVTHKNQFRNSMYLTFLEFRNYLVHKITVMGLRKRNS